jgi:glycosyltransferase involved in cell wall biosynthesis
VTDVGDAARIVGDTGVVVPLRDPAALCAGWNALLDAGDANRRALGARARERIGERYSLTAVAGRYVKLYQEVAVG